jgi:hypothetical protein
MKVRSLVLCAVLQKHLKANFTSNARQASRCVINRKLVCRTNKLAQRTSPSIRGIFHPWEDTTEAHAAVQTTKLTIPASLTVRSSEASRYRSGEPTIIAFRLHNRPHHRISSGIRTIDLTIMKARNSGSLSALVCFLKEVNLPTNQQRNSFRLSSIT